MPTPQPLSCKQAPGSFTPVINRNKCEGKGPCVPACPYGVLVVRKFLQRELPALSLVGRVKSLVHGGMQAQVVHGDRCEACGLCVQACPEKAITLQRREVAASPA